MAIPLLDIEGTGAEIAPRLTDFADRRLHVIVLPASELPVHDFDILNWPHFDSLNWPHLHQLAAILCPFISGHRRAVWIGEPRWNYSKSCAASLHMV